MSGTARGKIEMLLSSGTQAGDARDLWTSIYNHFVNLENAGVASIVSLYWGVGGTGTDYTGGGAPSGTGAFFVGALLPNANRTHTIYWLFQWTEDSTVDPGNAAPATRVGLARSITNGGVFAAAAVAADEDGNDANPWGGSTNGDGADSKSDPVWVTPANGTALYYPYQNADGGSQDASRDGIATLYGDGFAAGYADSRAHLVTDDDSLVVTVDYDATGTQDDWIWGVALEGIEPYGDPLSSQHIPALAFDARDEWFETAFGSLTGCVPIDGASPEVYWGGLDTIWQARQPNDCYATPRYMMRALPAYGAYDTTRQDASGQGFVGQTQPEFAAYVAGLPGADTLDGLSRFVCNSGAAGIGVAIPWDGVTVPGTGTTPQGTDF